MTVTERPVSEKYARKKLAWLADEWEDMGEAERELLLGALTHPSLPPPCGTSPACSASTLCLACLFAEYQDARRTWRDLVDGVLSWEQFEPGLTCAARQERAIEVAAMWMAGVEDVLVRGVGAGRRRARAQGCGGDAVTVTERPVTSSIEGAGSVLQGGVSPALRGGAF